MNPEHPSFAPKPPDPTDGVLLVDKPAGPTSHDIVDRIRRHSRIKKVGHGGTLDPMATGLLIILTGRGTRLSESIMGYDKVYEGVMRLGASTDTQDVDGRIIGESDASGVTREQLEAVMSRFLGDLMQIPPMVSAIKMNGVPLYKLARKGETVERKPRLIHVYSFSLLDYTAPHARFRLKCTKGTYVRTLCADIGAALGCGAYLAELRRTRIGALKIEDAFSMDKILGMTLGELSGAIIPAMGFSMRDAGA